MPTPPEDPHLGPARAWAAGLHPGQPVAWRGLEVAAFADHPGVLTQLDPARRFGRRPRPGGRLALTLLWAVPLGLLAAAVVGSPVWAYATLRGDRFGRSTPDPEVTLPVAGAFFAVSLGVLVAFAIRFFRGGRLRSLAGESLALGYAGLGVLSLVTAVRAGQRDDVPHWQLWVVPMALTALIAGVLLVLLVRAGLVDRRASRDALVAGQRSAERARFARVQHRIGRLSATEQTAVRDDLDAAVADLVARGVVTAADGERARQIELGRLALQMSQEAPRRS